MSTIPRCLGNRIVNDGQIVSLTRRRALLPERSSGTHCCYRLSKPKGLVRLEGLGEQKEKTAWPESALVKLVATSADRGCHMVSVSDPYGRVLGFLDRSRYFFFQVAPQSNSRGWVNPVPDPLRLRKFGSGGNLTRTSWYAARNSDH
jgi:hypothetical protein